MTSVGLVCNIYQEANALPGFLEMAAEAGFDDVAFYHTGPGGSYSTDGTIELIKKWGARIEFGSIDEGFGTVRTKAVRLSNCEFAMILDADERFHRFCPQLRCNDALEIAVAGPPFDQMAYLRDILRDCPYDAIRTCRRHWHDFSWRRPTQNFSKNRDYQLRIVRNAEQIYYAPKPAMHEQILDRRTGAGPYYRNEDELLGPFYDHYHCWFKPFEPEQRKHDIAIYNALAEGRAVPIA